MANNRKVKRQIKKDLRKAPGGIKAYKKKISIPGLKRGFVKRVKNIL